MANARIAVDIGGTFTDVVADTGNGELFTCKTPTTPAAPEEGFLAGVDQILQLANLTPADISVIIHGTTLATNALIERRGAVTALLTTEGHRDSLEMAYEHRFEQYDVQMVRPKPLVPRWLRLPIRERMNAAGQPLVDLELSSVDKVIPVLDEEAVTSVAIGFLHAYANSSHEEAVAEHLLKARPSLSVSLASHVAPEIREYERQSTVVANAYVRPLMSSYLSALAQTLRNRGFQCPVLMMTSGGGLCTLETACDYPIRLVESGPAGGAVLASAVAKRIEAQNLLSFDMGGTTAKMCFIENFSPTTARLFEVDRSYRFKKGSGIPVRIPVIEMVEIGAGGGSIGAVDSLNRITAGPESAGADPGPAIYGNGGAKATVTDADFVLGKISPAHFAGGKIPLDEAAGAKVIRGSVGELLSLSPTDAAFGLTEVVDENMAAAARAHAVELGRDIHQFTMAAFGGAAPLHAARLAEKLGIEKIIVPQGAGVGSALGFLLAPASFEIVKSMPSLLNLLDSDAIRTMFKIMREEAEKVVSAAAPDAETFEVRTAFMRYQGQGYEIPVTLPEDAIDKEELRTAFMESYERLYGRVIPGIEIEILTWSLKLEGQVTAEAAHHALTASGKGKIGERKVFDPIVGEVLDYSLIERNSLNPDDVISGPALIIEDQTTIVVTSIFNGEVSEAGDIILTRSNGRGA